MHDNADRGDDITEQKILTPCWNRIRLFNWVVCCWKSLFTVRLTCKSIFYTSTFAGGGWTLENNDIPQYIQIFDHFCWRRGFMDHAQGYGKRELWRFAKRRALQFQSVIFIREREMWIWPRISELERKADCTQRDYCQSDFGDFEK